MRCQRKYSGFTLVEMSIVLVIIGLIVGGVIVGKDLVQTARLQKIASEVNQIRTAVNLFVGQYDALPGDIENAYDYWGANCASTAGGCNGNGDGVINEGNPAYEYESYMSWRHLNLANIYPGNYTGFYLPISTAALGVNVPEASIKGAGYMITNESLRNVIWIGKIADRRTLGRIVTPTEAQSLDKKMDDGSPINGNVRGRTGFGSSILQGYYTASYGSPPNVYRVWDPDPIADSPFL